VGTTILILKTGEALPAVRRRCGDFEHWIARGLGRPVESLEVAAVHADAPLPAPDRIDGVVVTGSPAMVSERADWSERAARWLAGVVREDAVPVLGLCYGHQLLAHALGGVVGPNPRGREMGTVEVALPASERRDVDADAGAAEGANVAGPAGLATRGHREAADGLAPLFEAGVFAGHCSHVESVLRPPPGARVLARTRLDPHSAIAYGPRQWGVQFHPEFDVEIMRGYVEVRREVLVAESFDPDALISGARETPELTAVLSRFAAIVDGLPALGSDRPEWTPGPNPSARVERMRTEEETEEEEAGR
jgi:GMP synthase (glutamine-hydrolysing)